MRIPRDDAAAANASKSGERAVKIALSGTSEALPPESADHRAHTSCCLQAYYNDTRGKRSHTLCP